MRFVLFYHSFVSCWNHGNAHFLRGIVRELIRCGHEVIVYEPADGWSRMNALEDGGASALAEAAKLVPGVVLRTYRSAALRSDHVLHRVLDRALHKVDVVIAHEWTAPELIATLRRRRRTGRFLLLFHDTHHRALSAPQTIQQFELDGFDGVLAYGEALRETYVRRGWGRSVFTWHEAADVSLFRPSNDALEDDLIWIGNWGDGERSEELQRFLLTPVAALGIRARVYGVRYPSDLVAAFAGQYMSYGGWLPNHRVPDAYARARVTVHVPRRPYLDALPGIPTIRMFEALACGIPLASALWRDEEHLFPDGSYLLASNSCEMARALRLVLQDRALAADLARRGLAAIRSSHTCAHRVQQLFGILGQFGLAAHTGNNVSSTYLSAIVS